VFAEIEAAARREILRCGGSLSHHHGVGTLRREFLPEIWSPAALDWTRRAKRALDPEQIFVARNHSPLEPRAVERPETTAEAGGAAR
jgi:alkyldihydroxyacetonephosphate synthase